MTERPFALRLRLRLRPFALRPFALRPFALRPYALRPTPYAYAPSPYAPSPYALRPATCDLRPTPTTCAFALRPFAQHTTQVTRRN